MILEAGWALDTSRIRAHRLTAGVEILEDRFEPLPERPGDLLPDPRTFRYVFVGYELAESDLVKLNYVNRDLRVEDFNLGGGSPRGSASRRNSSGRPGTPSP